MSSIVGILPAAGVGARLNPFPYAKELLPVVYAPNSSQRVVQPLLAIEYSLRAFQLAGMKEAIVVTSPSKPEILRCLGSGSRYDMSLVYRVQDEPSGLAPAVDLAYDWMCDRCACLSLPDTLYWPETAIQQLVEFRQVRNLDLALSVFPTEEPQELGPVRVTQEGLVQEILDKPKTTDLRNTWGQAVWSPQFTEFLHSRMRGSRSGVSEPLGRVFDAALRERMKVQALQFQAGKFVDLGRTSSLASLFLESNEQ